MPPTPQQVIAANLPVVVLGLVVLALLIKRGVLTRRALDDAPARRGVLGLGDVIITVGVLLVGQVLAGMALGALGLRPPADRDATAEELLALMVGGQCAMALAAGFVLVRASAAVEGGVGGFGLALSRLPAGIGMALRCVLPLFILPMATSAVVGIGMVLMGETPPMIAHDALNAMRDEGAGAVRWGLILSAVLLAPALEEILFRGMFQTALLQSILPGRWAAIAVASAVFAVIHWGAATPAALPSLFVLSMGLGYAYEKTGSLAAPILLHAAFNAIQTAIALSLPETGPV